MVLPDWHSRQRRERAMGRNVMGKNAVSGDPAPQALEEVYTRRAILVRASVVAGGMTVIPTVLAACGSSTTTNTTGSEGTGSFGTLKKNGTNLSSFKPLTLMSRPAPQRDFRTTSRPTSRLDQNTSPATRRTSKRRSRIAASTSAPPHMKRTSLRTSLSSNSSNRPESARSWPRSRKNMVRRRRS